MVAHCRIGVLAACYSSSLLEHSAHSFILRGSKVMLVATSSVAEISLPPQALAS